MSIFPCVFVQEIGNLSFDKDDQLAVEFVTAAANIRAKSFGIPLHSLFEAKGIAGNIVHAVATTNAIIAGLIVIEAIKVLQNDIKSYRYVQPLHHPLLCTMLCFLLPMPLFVICILIESIILHILHMSCNVIFGMLVISIFLSLKHS